MNENLPEIEKLNTLIKYQSQTSRQFAAMI